MPPKSKKESVEEEALKKISEVESAFGGDFDLGEIGEMTIYREYTPIRGIPTGSLTFDWALGGGRGLARGAFTRFSGEPGSGKSTACMMIGANSVAQNLKVAVIPTEGRWNQEYAYNSGMGLPNKDYFLGAPLYAEGVGNLLVDLASKDFDIAIVDSATAMSPKEELDAGLDEQSYAKIAKFWSEFFRKRMSKISNSSLAVILVDQLRTKIGVMYGSPVSHPGGRALEYYCSVCVDFKRGEMDYFTAVDKEKHRNPYGMTIKAEVYKNSIAPPYRPIELPIRFMNGIAIDTAEEIVEFGKQFSVFVGKTGGEISGGSHWYYNGEILGTSRQEAKGKISNDPELMTELIGKVREQMTQR